MAGVPRVKIVVVGDSGVGKTALADRICCIGMKFFTWTIGCSVTVKLHPYKQGTPEENTFFVELYDVGGSNHHKESRSVFYQSTHGVILVHDLTNRKSLLNLQRWLAEILSPDDESLSNSNVDSEQFVGTSQIPIFVVGTKWDLIDENLRKKLKRTSSSIAEQCGGDEIYVDLNNKTPFAPGSTNAVKLSRFFDKVIERQHFSREITSPYSDRKKTSVYSPPYSTPPMSAYSPPTLSKMYHND